MPWLPCSIQVFHMLMWPLAWASALSLCHSIFGIHSAFLSRRHWEFQIISNTIWMTADKIFHLVAGNLLLAKITAVIIYRMVVLQIFILATCILMAFFYFPEVSAIWLLTVWFSWFSERNKLIQSLSWVEQLRSESILFGHIRFSWNGIISQVNGIK